MKKIIPITLALLLTACQQAPNAYVPEPFAFETNAIAPIRLNVAEIKVVNGYTAPLRKPNVEHEFPVTPATAVRQWVNKRLKAIGSNNILEITIDNASVKEVPLPKTKGVEGLFTDDQDTRYDAKLVVTMRLYSGTRAMSDASADITITRSRSINEKATVFDRERLYHSMVREMMASFDGEANKQLRQYFSNYLK